MSKERYFLNPCSNSEFISCRCSLLPVAYRSGSTHPSPGDEVAQFAGAGSHSRGDVCFSCPSVRDLSFAGPSLASFVPPYAVDFEMARERGTASLLSYGAAFSSEMR